MIKLCPDCGGTGHRRGKDCFYCDGQGWIIIREQKDISKEIIDSHGIN